MLAILKASLVHQKCNKVIASLSFLWFFVADSKWKHNKPDIKHNQRQADGQTQNDVACSSETFEFQKKTQVFHIVWKG